MTREELIRRNDEARRFFRGVRVLMSPAILELPARIRGRMLFRLSLYNTFHPESDHSEGVFIFAGWSFFWIIREMQGELTLSISLKEDL